MSSNADRTARKYEVALSFAGEDRPYVAEVAEELRRHNVSVFYDGYEEASLWGKNLYDHLTRVYSEEAEYTVMFVSAAYAQKVWTNRKRESAQSRAFVESREYILPARFDDTPVAGLLNTIGYVDLRAKTPKELAALILLKVRPPATHNRGGEDLLGEDPLFAAALEELRTHQGLSYAICEAILTADAAPEHLGPLLVVAVQQSQAFARLGIGKFAIDCIDKFDVGYEAVDFCLSDDALDQQQREWLGMHMQYVTRPDVVRWAHAKLTRVVKSDTYYNSFLQKHLEFLITELRPELTAYLLVPDRGPARYNIDSLFLIAKAAAKPQPFVQRLRDWILNGRFDDARGDENSGDASILYKYLNSLAEIPATHPLQDLRAIAVDRVRSLLNESGTFDRGLYHLYVMRSEDFVDMEVVRDRVWEQRVFAANDDQRRLFDALYYNREHDPLALVLLAQRAGAL